MMRFRAVRILGVSIFLCLILLSSPAYSNQTAMNYFVDGIEAFDIKDYQEALTLFNQAIELEPANLEFQYYLGVTYACLGMDKEALEIFQSTVDKDPVNFFKAYFDVAALHSKKRRYQEALDTLSLAEKIEPDNARVYLDKGYAYKDLKEYERAIESFNRARELDPKLTQLIYYMTGAVNIEREQFDNAAKMFEKAIQVDPKTPLAGNARETLPRIETAAWIRKPWYLTTSFAWGYNDNVPLDPLQDITGRPPGLPSNQEDQFQTFFLKGGYKFLNRKDLEAGLGYTLFSIGYKDWTENNVTSHSPHIYIQGNYNPVYFRFQYDFSYFYAGGKNQWINPPVYLTFANNSFARLRMHSFMPTITILEAYDLRTDINFNYQIKDYLDGITKNADRIATDITQSYKIPNIDCFPRIGYRYAHEDSDDESSTYHFNEVFVGVSGHIYWGIRGDLSFAYMVTHYPDFTPDQGRRDSTYTTAFSLNRNFFDRLLIAFNYYHLHNDSNFIQDAKDYYSFRQNIYLLSLTYSF